MPIPQISVGLTRTVSIWKTALPGATLISYGLPFYCVGEKDLLRI